MQVLVRSVVAEELLSIDLGQQNPGQRGGQCWTMVVAELMELVDVAIVEVAPA